MRDTMYESNRRSFLGIVAASLVLSPAAFAEEHDERERWHKEQQERREHSWKDNEHDERHARAEAELRERPQAFHRENHWVGPGYYYDGHAYTYFDAPPPAYFWGEVPASPPAPSIDIVVPIRIR
jgi:hypothetical protein